MILYKKEKEKGIQHFSRTELVALFQAGIDIHMIRVYVI